MIQQSRNVQNTFAPPKIIKQAARRFFRPSQQIIGLSVIKKIRTWNRIVVNKMRWLCRNNLNNEWIRIRIDMRHTNSSWLIRRIDSSLKMPSQSNFKFSIRSAVGSPAGGFKKKFLPTEKNRNTYDAYIYRIFFNSTSVQWPVDFFSRLRCILFFFSLSFLLVLCISTDSMVNVYVPKRLTHALNTNVFRAHYVHHEHTTKALNTSIKYKIQYDFFSFCFPCSPHFIKRARAPTM